MQRTSASLRLFSNFCLSPLSTAVFVVSRCSTLSISSNNPLLASSSSSRCLPFPGMRSLTVTLRAGGGDGARTRALGFLWTAGDEAYVDTVSARGRARALGLITFFLDCFVLRGTSASSTSMSDSSVAADAALIEFPPKGSATEREVDATDCPRRDLSSSMSIESSSGEGA